MAWLCRGCGGRYRIHLYRCPRCHGTSVDQEEPMPKITVHGGPSDASTDRTPEAVEVPLAERPDPVTEDGADEAPPPAEPAAESGTASDEDTAPATTKPRTARKRA